MRIVGLIFLIILVSITVVAQEADKPKVKPFDWGATIGLSTNLPVIKSITVDEIAYENVHLKYEIGYQASIFARVNIDRFFLQPSISWQHSESEILYSIPSLSETASLTSTTDSDENT